MRRVDADVVALPDSGFTLLELMIAVAVLGIIAAIAFPSYLNQVDRSRRADAKTALLQNAQLLERCYARTSSYDGCPNLLTRSPDGFYDLRNRLDGARFEVVAVPRGPQVRDAQRCASFSIDHRGNRTATGGAADDCW